MQFLSCPSCSEISTQNVTFTLIMPCALTSNCHAFFFFSLSFFIKNLIDGCINSYTTSIYSISPLRAIQLQVPRSISSITLPPALQSAAMDIKYCCSSGNESIISDCHGLSSLNFLASGSRAHRWRMLWRRIKREKKKLFNYPTPVHAPYDPYTYSQNFDQGLTWADPDNASRSFSARFAVPSRIFEES